jgi:NADH:ubiquinone oxidoreductase subunit 5 (subunit L)/multisubunit Na+/H+ antiporter MnhA subunit/multisubunit Na+/H+ antiporter MnhB subunit
LTGLDPSLLLPLATALPFVAALLVVSLGRAIGRASGWIVLAAALGSVGALARAAIAGATAFEQAWLPSIGVGLTLRLDGFGLLLALLVSGIGALVALYSLGYLADEPPARARRYYAALAAFMGAMLGIALADDLILLFVFWEITSVTSFLLIGHRAEDETARAGALTALQVTALGGLVMSVGFLLIGQLAGTFQLSRITGDSALVAAVVGSPLGTAALVLVLVGAFTKSAQVPFHFWLPRAMVAPTPISAYLHAATMVKAGVFLLGRLHPLFGTAPLWAPLLVVVGTTSMVLGAYQALRETDLKAILARTTGSTLGAITMLYGLGATGTDSLAILNHALYKGALFLVAGIVEHHAHTRSLDELGGLRRALPIAFVACVLAALSMAGLPPLLGFVAKDALFAALFHNAYLHAHPLLEAMVLAATLAASVLLVAVAARFTIGVFLGPARPAHRHAEAAHGLPLWPSPLLLALAALGLGLASAAAFTRALVVATASDYAGDVHVALVPPPGAPLYASLLALALGAALYAGRDAAAAWQRRLAVLPSAGAAWDALMAGIVRLAEGYSTRWQNGSLRWYLAATFLALPALCLPALWIVGLSWRDVATPLADLPWYGLLLCLLLVVTTVAAVGATTRLAAAIAMTSVGFLVSMLFVVYRSPDILLTQILIETVSTIFILLVLVFLPAFKPGDLPRASRLAHAAVAGAFGLTITLLLLLVMTPGLREPDNIAVRPGGLLSLALAQGGGHNAVNVIIVDIRAMDTTGEITVLVVVGLCIHGLLRSRRRVRGEETA